ncbi:MAG TPA: hypothetical protein VH143_15785 [Kofleriaceae bacterium]|jgi:hypothetical protein|nr:hypothetical protein [Kofleriaceae bacterium]
MRFAWVLAMLLGCHRVPQRAARTVHDGFADIHPSLLITNPRVVMALELAGWSFGDVLGARDPSAPRRTDYAEESALVLTHSPAYSDLVAALRGDLEALSAKSPSVGVGQAYMYRLFDIDWLASARAHFELVGVVNRFDFRTAAVPGCGQTRLIYRLAYQPAAAGRPQTRLPMTVSVIYLDRGSDCGAVAQRWLALEGTTGVELAGKLRAGPLAGLVPTAFDRIEIDVQSMRVAAPAPDTEIHAEYILRGFDRAAARLVASPLRNSPSADLSAAKLDSLRAWIGDHLAAIDSGTAELPAEFLATSAVSVTPHGLSRLANRPFKRLFPDAAAAFGGLARAGTPDMLVRRLDEMSCVGCHQSRSIAGFHLLGEDRTGETRDAMVLGISPHLSEILAWRFRFLRAGAAATEAVPLAEHADDGGGYGAHCRSDRWPCAAGLECRPSIVDGDDVGLCLPAGAAQPGDPCQRVTLVSSFGLDGDGATPDASTACGAARSQCDPNAHGFPGGMCTAKCIEGSRVGDAICARIPHHGFERACFQPGVKPEECITKPGNFALALLRSCSRTEACRDDYVCLRVPNVPLDHGACVPPYFLSQVRIDGPPIDR